MTLANLRNLEVIPRADFVAILKSWTEGMISQGQLARLLRAHPCTIYRWRKAGLKHYFVGGRVYFSAKEVLDWLQDDSHFYVRTKK